MPVDQNDGRNQGSPPVLGPPMPQNTPVPVSGQLSKPLSGSGGGTDTTAGISAADWALVQQIAAAHGIDPYVLVAIGMHETGWGTLGQGRHGLILGVGAYDSGATNQWAGLQPQLEKGAELLQKWGVHTIDDIRAGKAAAWATDPGWEQGVSNWYSKVTGKTFAAPVSTAAAGGAGAGVAQGGAPTAAAPHSRADYEATVGQYSWIAALAHQIPELNNILEQAVREQWEPGSGKFAAAVQNTAWWKQHTDADKNLQELKANNPTEYQRQIDRQFAVIVNESKTLGINIGYDQAVQFARQSIIQGWSPQEIQAAVGNLWHYDPKNLTGTASNVVTQLRDLSKSYEVPLSDATLQQWSQKVLAGQGQVSDFEGQIREMAKSMYPSLSGSIDRGVTVSQFLDPYITTLAKTWEVDPASISLDNTPLLKKSLQYVDPNAKDGAMSVMPVWQVERQAKDDARWLTTNNARDSLVDTALQVGKDWGFVAQ